MKEQSRDMNSIRKCSIKQHGSVKKPQTERVKPALRWQSYLLALVMVVGFFVFTQSVMAESKTADTPAVGLSELPVATEPAKADSKPDEASKDLAATALSQIEDAPASTSQSSGITPEPAPSQAAEELPIGPQQEPEFAAAQTVVTEFYRQLDSGDFGQAYDKLSPDFRETLSYHRFNEGYSSTSAISCNIQHSEQLSDDLVRFDIAISVTENGVDSRYYATCLVRKLADSWWLDGVGQVRG